jgi:hypothetical protein
MLTEPTNVDKYLSYKEVLADIKEIVVEMGEDVEQELSNIFIEFGSVEEILLFSTAYPFSNFLCSNIVNNIVWEEKEDLSINSGWWYRSGILTSEDIFVLKVTDGIVDNYFVFIKNIS